jgi:hypothetical protein
MGESPSITAQGTVMSWPSFKGRSPNVKGKIFGGTARNNGTSCDKMLHSNCGN